MQILKSVACLVLFSLVFICHPGRGFSAEVSSPPPSADLRPERVKVSKAEGPDARRIAEIFSQKAELKGKTVLVRGKVVKLTRGVLGKNWIHIRDGSGDDSSHNNDITLTTQATVAMGDVVLAKGTVALDKNIGSGYFFAVMIEDATLTK